MFARKIRVEYEEDGRRRPCPLKWLDSFSMRNFTNASVFDDTLPVADGVMEIGTHVPVEPLRDAMEDWFGGKAIYQKARSSSSASRPSAQPDGQVPVARRRFPRRRLPSFTYRSAVT